MQKSLLQEESSAIVQQDPFQTLKRPASFLLPQPATPAKKVKPTHNFLHPSGCLYPSHPRSHCASSLTQLLSIQNDRKSRYSLAPVNPQYFLDPERSLLRVRRTSDLETVRTVRLGDKNQEISVVRMIPGRSSALAGDENGGIHYMSLENGLSEIIDVRRGRGNILDMSFCTNNRFVVVGENKECSFNQLKGCQVKQLCSRFQDSNFVRKVLFLSPDNFLAGQSFHNIRLYDTELLSVQHKISTVGSVYNLARLNNNIFCYGGSNNQVTYHDCRLSRQIMHFKTNQNWTGVIRHLDANAVMFSDWRTIVLADVRKGVIEGYRTKARSGIWDAVVADAGTLLVASSDCRVVKMGINRE